MFQVQDPLQPAHANNSQAHQPGQPSEAWTGNPAPPPSPNQPQPEGSETVQDHIQDNTGPPDTASQIQNSKEVALESHTLQHNEPPTVNPISNPPGPPAKIINFRSGSPYINPAPTSEPESTSRQQKPPSRQSQTLETSRTCLCH